jgi:hypothetical protein
MTKWLGAELSTYQHHKIFPAKRLGANSLFAGPDNACISRLLKYSHNCAVVILSEAKNLVFSTA